MFNKIINYTFLISTFNGGLMYKCLKDLYDESKMKQNVYMKHSNSIFNFGMIIGGLIGFTLNYLNCPVPLHKMLKFENNI
jgi:hypothetical protein